VPGVLATAEGIETLGRFELRRLLGQGAQATVWLGYDTHLEREVAVKVLRAKRDTNAELLMQWLREARSVSRLNHPNVVPLFEADMAEGQPFLVFEYVAGQTLGQLIRAQGALGATSAVGILLDVLQALAAAHAAGIVHRDLKPSNVLIDETGRARVMDFGIAVKVNDTSDGSRVVGTPGYLSPEAAQGLAPTPVMDIYSAGLLLVELLSGKALIAERDPYRAIYRAAHEDLTPPEDLCADADDVLRGIAMRAIARDPKTRFPTVTEFIEALRAWLLPAPAAVDDSGARASGGSNGTLDFLLRRMRHKSDFPALSDSVSRIQRIATSEDESLHSLAEEILKDVALTNKLLRLVNTVQFRHAGGGTISTVSRAAALVGFAGIRNMALSLLLLEHMQDRVHANLLKEEFLRALMAGTLASELCPTTRESEESFIGAMFQNLGRLLTEFYLAEEARQIRTLTTRGLMPGESPRPAAEASAAVQVLGISFEDLGIGVARSWGLPETLQKCMRKSAGEPPSRQPDSGSERLRWLALAANDLTDTLLRGDTNASVAVQNTAERYARVLGVSSKSICEATVAAQLKLSDSARAMNLQVQPGSRASRLLAARVSPSDNATTANTDSLAPHALQATPIEADAVSLAKPLATTPSRTPGQAAQTLAAGVQEITDAMTSDSFRLNEVLRMVLETMLRALGLRRVVFCLRDPKTETLTGRFGLGDDAAKVALAFKVPLKGQSDLFTAICLKGADTLIRDATVDSVSKRLPLWYRQSINAPSFLMLPMVLKGAPFAFIYADQATAGAIELDEKELSLLRTLRNQAVMAFKQAS
jgi:serine/threonine protein kinase